MIQAFGASDNHLRLAYCARHRTLCEFRRRHLEEFGRLFVEVVGVAREMGVVRFGTLSVDGTKVRANASKLRVAPPPDALSLPQSPPVASLCVAAPRVARRRAPPRHSSVLGACAAGNCA